MATITVSLQKGITIGDKVHRDAVLREPTALDVIEATIDSEKVVMVPSGISGDGEAVLTPQLISSPTMVGIKVLLKQIVRIGDIQGPIDTLFIGKLSPEDLNILQRAANGLENASLEVALRGRSDSAGENPAEDN